MNRDIRAENRAWYQGKIDFYDRLIIKVTLESGITKAGKKRLIRLKRRKDRELKYNLQHLVDHENSHALILGCLFYMVIGPLAYFFVYGLYMIGAGVEFIIDLLLKLF